MLAFCDKYCHMEKILLFSPNNLKSFSRKKKNDSLMTVLIVNQSRTEAHSQQPYIHLTRLTVQIRKTSLVKES